MSLVPKPYLKVDQTFGDFWGQFENLTFYVITAVAVVFAISGGNWATVGKTSGPTVPIARSTSSYNLPIVAIDCSYTKLPTYCCYSLQLNKVLYFFV